MTKYGRSPWIDTAPKSRIRTYPRYKGSSASPVVIVGGGLTGCATAYAFAAAGVHVVLLEADQIGRGGTAFSSGWVGADPGPVYGNVEKAFGLKFARHAFRSWRRAALDAVALLRRLDIKCDLEENRFALVATTPDEATQLKKDAKARRDAGLESPMLTAKAARDELALDALAGIKDSVGAVIDPFRACLGLAAAAEERGASLFEHSPVRKITFDRKKADVVLEGGTIRAGRVILATGVPNALSRALIRHFWLKTTYLVLTERIPAAVRRQIAPRGVVIRDTSAPPHLVRRVGEDQVLVAGADIESPPPRLADKTIVQRTGQLMYELSVRYPEISGILPQYGWSSSYALTADGLPFIGPHRNFPHQLFALGDASRGVTGAYLASRLLLRYYTNEVDPADEMFAFTRYER